VAVFKKDVSMQRSINREYRDFWHFSVTLCAWYHQLLK